jgi:hypothetical protein
VMMGSPQPPEVTGSDHFWHAWRLTEDSSAVIVVGYRFAAGLDGGCWDAFRRQAGRCKVPVHVVDPDAVHVARDVAWGVAHHPPVGHPLAWHRLGYVVLHLMSRRRCEHPRQLLPFVREILRLHDELAFIDEPGRWEAALADGGRRMRPKSLAL